MAAMGLVFVQITAVRMVELWPLEGIRWRAEMGDQRAIEAMSRITLGTDEWPYWAQKRRWDLTQTEIVFFDAETRRMLGLLREARGQDTSLLQVMEGK